MFCSWCDNEIKPLDRYLQVGDLKICEYCVEDGMEEHDPEGNEIDMQTDEMIERSNNNG